MKYTKNSIVAAALFGTAAGLASWFSGIAPAMWPDHPILGALLIAVFTGLVVSSLWPAITRKRS